MRTDDINKFKGELKSTLQQWGNTKIDEIFPDKPQIKVMAKNGLNNIMAKCDDKLNKWIDTFMLFAGKENGIIDSDAVVEMAAEMFKELEPNRYQFEFMDIEVGKGQVVFHLPQNMLFDLLLGKSGSIKLTADDILELKEMFNN